MKPPETDPFDLGPVELPRDPAERRPIDDFLERLYGPPEEPVHLIQAEPAGRGPKPFPPGMWLWAAGTLALAVLVIVLFLT